MGYTSAQAKEFINYIAPMIISEATFRGYKVASTVIAQAIIEGASGTSILAKHYHNHFGLKAGQAWLKAGKPSVNMRTKEEYIVGKPVTINDYFRKYSSDPEGVKGYYDFISTNRYANLKEATNYKQYAEFLKKDGYATSSTYVNTLCSTVEKYDLQRFDNLYPDKNMIKNDIDTIAKEVIDGLWSSGTTRKLRLEQAGYNYQEVQNRVNEILRNKK